MAMIEEKAYKANSKSQGIGVDYILWINFGPSLFIKANSTPITVLNELENGYTIEFTISGYDNTMSMRSNSLPVPYGDLGTLYYTGVNGYPAIYPAEYNPSGNSFWGIKINNIIVKQNGIQVYNYSMVVADAESTNNLNVAETIKLFSVNGIWSLYEWIYPTKQDSIGSKPDLIGIGTQNLLEKGTAVPWTIAPAAIALSQSPTNLDITMTSDTGRQAVALGIFINSQGVPITKYPFYQKLYIDRNTSFFYNISFNSLNDQRGYINYVVTDSIDKGIILDENNTKVYQILDEKKYSLKYKIEFQDGTITIIIPVEEVKDGSKVIIELALIAEMIDSDTLIKNRASLRITTPSPNNVRVSVSNVAETLFDNKTPSIKKLTTTPKVVVREGNEVLFTIKISNLDIGEDETITVYDELDSLIGLNIDKSKVYTIVNGAKKTLEDVDISINKNIVKISFNSNDLPADFDLNSIVEIYLVTNILYKYPLDDTNSISNYAYIKINDEEKSYLSNRVIVKLMTMNEAAKNDVIQSISCMSKSLAHITNAEGEKIQFILEKAGKGEASEQDIIEVNKSVTGTITAITDLINLLQKILSQVLKNKLTN